MQSSAGGVIAVRDMLQVSAAAAARETRVPLRRHTRHLGRQSRARLSRCAGGSRASTETQQRTASLGMADTKGGRGGVEEGESVLVACECVTLPPVDPMRAGEDTRPKREFDTLSQRRPTPAEAWPFHFDWPKQRATAQRLTTARPCGSVFHNSPSSALSALASIRASMSWNLNPIEFLYVRPQPSGTYITNFPLFLQRLSISTLHFLFIVSTYLHEHDRKTRKKDVSLTTNQSNSGSRETKKGTAAVTLSPASCRSEPSITTTQPRGLGSRQG